MDLVRSPLQVVAILRCCLLDYALLSPCTYTRSRNPRNTKPKRALNRRARDSAHSLKILRGIIAQFVTKPNSHGKAHVHMASIPPNTSEKSHYRRDMNNILAIAPSKLEYKKTSIGGSLARRQSIHIRSTVLVRCDGTNAGLGRHAHNGDEIIATRVEPTNNFSWHIQQ